MIKFHKGHAYVCGGSIKALCFFNRACSWSLHPEVNTCSQNSQVKEPCPCFCFKCLDKALFPNSFLPQIKQDLTTSSGNEDWGWTSNASSLGSDTWTVKLAMIFSFVGMHLSSPCGWGSLPYFLSEKKRNKGVNPKMQQIIVNVWTGCKSEAQQR